MTEKKASRTILILKDQKFDLENCEINNKFTSNNGNNFIEFKNDRDSKKVLEKLLNNDVKCKYSYYNIFFRMKKDISNLSLEELKKLVSDNVQFNIIDSIFYTKNNNFIGSGYIILDSFTDYNTLINNKSVTINNNENENINFYKFYRKNN